jgi:hypothetical protein
VYDINIPSPTCPYLPEQIRQISSEPEKKMSQPNLSFDIMAEGNYQVAVREFGLQRANTIHDQCVGVDDPGKRARIFLDALQELSDEQAGIVHLTIGELRQYLDGKLVPARVSHAYNCERCQQEAAALATHDRP